MLIFNCIKKNYFLYRTKVKNVFTLIIDYLVKKLRNFLALKYTHSVYRKEYATILLFIYYVYTIVCSKYYNKNDLFQIYIEIPTKYIDHDSVIYH